MRQDELAMIQRAKTGSDDFARLFDQYRPLVLTVIRNYYIRSFTQDDWLQEARLAMLKAISRYNGEQGSQFGPYYRLVLTSHIRSLLRKELAIKRQADAEAVSIEANVAVMGQARFVTRDVEMTVLMRIEIRRYLNELSAGEVVALSQAVSRVTEPANIKINLDRRALERAKAKLKHFLND